MRKNYQINIPVSREEKKIIEVKAMKLGMTVAGFMRFLGTAFRGRE